jgi:hypothetical protein
LNKIIRYYKIRHRLDQSVSKINYLLTRLIMLVGYFWALWIGKVTVSEILFTPDKICDVVSGIVFWGVCQGLILPTVLI